MDSRQRVIVIQNAVNRVVDLAIANNTEFKFEDATELAQKMIDWAEGKETSKFEAPANPSPFSSKL